MEKTTDFMKTLTPQDYEKSFLFNGCRSDGRGFDDFRPVAIQAKVVSTADGSAMIGHGDSLIIASVQGELGRPRSDSKDQGRIEIRMQQSSVKSDLGGGDDFLRSSQMNFCLDSIQSLVNNGALVDLKDLCVENEKLCWILRCDVMILDGAPSIDDCLMALSTAFHSLTLPEVILKPVENIVKDAGTVSENGARDDEDDKDEILFTPERIRVDTTKRRNLKLTETKPASSSFLVFQSKSTRKNDEADQRIVADPSLEESRALADDVNTGFVTIVIGENRSICGFYSTGTGSIINDSSMDQCLVLAESRRQLINRLISEA